MSDVMALSISNDNFSFDTLIRSIYTYPEIACIRELVANAIDSHQESGQEKKVDIFFKDGFVYIRDYGGGISDEVMNESFTVIMKSTKRDSTTSTGKYGLGSKTPFGILDDDGKLLTSYMGNINNGKHTVYRIGKNDDGFPVYQKVQSYDTDEESGLYYMIPVNNPMRGISVKSFMYIFGSIKDKVNISLPGLEQTNLNHYSDFDGLINTCLLTKDDSKYVQETNSDDIVLSFTRNLNFSQASPGYNRSREEKNLNFYIKKGSILYPVQINDFPAPIESWIAQHVYNVFSSLINSSTKFEESSISVYIDLDKAQGDYGFEPTRARDAYLTNKFDINGFTQEVTKTITYPYLNQSVNSSSGFFENSIIEISQLYNLVYFYMVYDLIYSTIEWISKSDNEKLHAKLTALLNGSTKERSILYSLFEIKEVREEMLVNGIDNSSGPVGNFTPENIKNIVGSVHCLSNDHHLKKDSLLHFSNEYLKERDTMLRITGKSFSNNFPILGIMPGIKDVKYYSVFSWLDTGEKSRKKKSVKSSSYFVRENNGDISRTNCKKGYFLTDIFDTDFIHNKALCEKMVKNGIVDPNICIVYKDVGKLMNKKVKKVMNDNNIDILMVIESEKQLSDYDLELGNILPHTGNELSLFLWSDGVIHRAKELFDVKVAKQTKKTSYDLSTLNKDTRVRGLELIKEKGHWGHVTYGDMRTVLEDETRPTLVLDENNMILNENNFIFELTYMKSGIDIHRRSKCEINRLQNLCNLRVPLSNVLPEYDVLFLSNTIGDKAESIIKSYGLRNVIDVCKENIDMLRNTDTLSISFDQATSLLALNGLRDVRFKNLGEISPDYSLSSSKTKFYVELIEGLFEYKFPGDIQTKVGRISDNDEFIKYMQSIKNDHEFMSLEIKANQIISDIKSKVDTVISKQSEEVLYITKCTILDMMNAHRFRDETVPETKKEIFRIFKENVLTK